MSRILTSIHGKKLGLDHDGRLICPNGIVTGNHGSQVQQPGPNQLSFFDDFLEGFEGTDKWRLIIGTDDGGSVMGAADVNGVYRLTSGAAGTGLAADGAHLSARSAPWRAFDGNLVFETRLKITAVTTCACYWGFSDTVGASLEIPIMSASSADTLTSNATNAVGFMYDTAMATDDLWLVGVDGDTDATPQDTGAPPPTNGWQTYRIEVDSTGGAVFYINGIQVGTYMADAVSATGALTPFFYVGKRSVTASMRMDIDYVHVFKNRV